MTTPTCPACGASFPYPKGGEDCKKCGCPRTVAELGKPTIVRWMKQHSRSEGLSKRAAKKAARSKRVKATNKHGRVGVKR